MSKKKTTDNGLDSMVDDIRSRFGEDSVMTLDDHPQDVEAISTRSLGLDHALGVGGLPRGRITEVYGPEGVGKTTLALHVVAEAQSRGESCAYIDLEHAMDPTYAKAIGVDTKKLLISQPGGGEEALKIAEAMIQSAKLAVVVFDSVAAVIPRSEMDGEIGDAHMAGQARLMSQALRMLTGKIAKSGTLVVFVNQLRTNIGAYSPNGQVPETTSGGRALKYAASVRIDLRRTNSIKRGEEVVGARIRAKVVKNKVAPPFRQTEYDLIYGEGISREGELLALGEMTKVLSKAGTAYRWGDVVLGRGYEASRQYLRDNAESAKKIQEEIIKKL